VLLLTFLKTWKCQDFNALGFPKVSQRGRERVFNPAPFGFISWLATTKVELAMQDYIVGLNAEGKQT
jgi:hypothetical protein